MIAVPFRSSASTLFADLKGRFWDTTRNELGLVRLWIAAVPILIAFMLQPRRLLLVMNNNERSS